MDSVDEKDAKEDVYSEEKHTSVTDNSKYNHRLRDTLSHLQSHQNHW